jgi:hypothetical protein
VRERLGWGEREKLWHIPGYLGNVSHFTALQKPNRLQIARYEAKFIIMEESVMKRIVLVLAGHDQWQLEEHSRLCRLCESGGGIANATWPHY